MQAGRALVIRSGALGDFLFTLPVLDSLRATHPGWQVEMMGHSEMLELVDGRSLADAVHSIDRADVSALFSDRMALPAPLARQLSGYGLVLAYLPDHDGLLRRNLASACSGRVAVHSPVLPKDGRVHIVDHLLKPVEELGCTCPTRVPKLHLAAADREAGERLLKSMGVDLSRPRVAVHPGAGSKLKRWPAERFAQFVDQLVDELTVLLISGPADETVTGEMLDLCEHRERVVVLARMPVLAVAQSVLGCAAFVGNDTGITHLAAAVEVPTVALFGPTDPSAWAPRGPHVRVLVAADHRIESIDLPTVVAALRACTGGRQDAR